jgi:hypothetical protein
MLSREFRAGSVWALAVIGVVAWIVGCGGGDRGRGQGAPMAKADAVEVTYYYLPG